MKNPETLLGFCVPLDKFLVNYAVHWAANGRDLFTQQANCA